MPEPLFTRRFFGLWVFAFITFFSAFQLLPAIPFRIIQLGGSRAAAGWFLSAYTFASALAAPMMGTVADHIGRKRLLVIASSLFIVFSVLYGAVTNIGLLLLIAVVHGALWSGLLAASSAIMSDFIPVSRRTEGLAYWGMSSTAAIAIGPAVGLIIYNRSSWMVLCGEMALLSVVMLVWSARLPVIHEGPATTELSFLDAWDWRVIKAAASLAVIAFGYGGATSYVAILSIERRIDPPSLFFTVFAVTIVLVRIFTSHLGDRFGPKPIIYPAFTAIPMSFLILSMANTRWELVASGVLFGIGFGAVYPAFANFVLTHTDPKRRGRTFGSIVWAFDIGIGTGSLAIGAFGQRYGLGRAFGMAAVVSCLAIPIFLAASRELVRVPLRPEA
ncbi:MAG TPA: MFS transporter [Thermoanaerobaculia bacterium]|nr:MFS transporter [Thermoanaerobaculia bacterium]